MTGFSHWTGRSKNLYWTGLCFLVMLVASTSAQADDPDAPRFVRTVCEAGNAKIVWENPPGEQQQTYLWEMRYGLVDKIIDYISGVASNRKIHLNEIGALDPEKNYWISIMFARHDKHGKWYGPVQLVSPRCGGVAPPPGPYVSHIDGQLKARFPVPAGTEWLVQWRPGCENEPSDDGFPDAYQTINGRTSRDSDGFFELGKATMEHQWVVRVRQSKPGDGKWSPWVSTIIDLCP